MARPSKSQTIIDAEAHFTDPPPPQYPATIPGNEAEDDLDDVTALHNVLAELGASESGGGFINIYREKQLPGGRKGDKEYIGRFEAAEFSNGGLLESIKSQHGPGTYEINVYHSGGHGLATRKKITIADDPQSRVAAPVAPQAVDLTPVLTAIQESNKGVVAAIMAMAQGQVQKQPSRAEMLEEMRIMREMFAPATNAQPANYNPVELMKLGMEMAGNGGGEGNNAWVDKMLTTFGPLLAHAVEKPAQPAARPTLPAPHARPVAVEQPLHTEEDPVNLLITNYLNLLTRAAEKSAPVEEYADSILTMIPQSSIAEVEALLRPSDWRERLKQRTQAAEQYPVWFTSLRDTILQYIDDDRAEANQSASTHLTGSETPVSVPGHENASDIVPVISGGDPASPA